MNITGKCLIMDKSGDFELVDSFELARARAISTETIHLINDSTEFLPSVTWIRGVQAVMEDD